MNNDPMLGTPDDIIREGKRLHRVTEWLPLASASITSYGLVNNEEWLDREAARFHASGIRCWIHHDAVTSKGALFTNRWYSPE